MNDWIIPLDGWAAGVRELRGCAGIEFFQKFGNTEILDAAVDVDITVGKSGRSIDVDLSLKGEVTTVCDRCLEDLRLPVETSPHFRVKFGAEPSEGEEESEDGREILYLPASSPELDLGQVIYDYVCLSLPLQKVHPEGECNPDTVKFLGQESGDEEAEQNSPFAALKGLFKQ